MAGQGTTAAPPAARRRWRAVLSALGGVLLVLLAGLAWLLASESGLRAGLRLAGWASGGQLATSDASGRLLGPLSIGALRLENDSLRVVARQLQLDWRASALFAGRLQVDRLAAAELRIASAPQDDPSPAAPPASLELPLALEVGTLALDLLVLEPWEAAGDAEPLFLVRDIAAALESDGRHHLLSGLRLALPDVQLAVDRFALDGRAPFALAGSGQLQGALDERAFAAQFALAGDLLAPRVELDAQGEGLAGRLELLAAPFAEVPVRRLQVELGEVDPAAFAAGAPRAALRLSADLRGEEAEPAAEEGAEGWALAGPLQIDNGLPGRVDDGLLPFARLSGVLRWDAGETRLDELVLDLPGDGRLSGELAWQTPPAEAQDTDALLPGRLQAALTLARVDPARLHGALPALAISGRLDAAAAGSRQTLDAALQAEGADLQARLGVDMADAAAPAFELAARLRALDLGRLSAAAPEGRLGLDLELRGRLADEALQADAELQLVDTRLQGLALEGGGRLGVDGERIRDADLAFTLGGNRLQLAGAWGRAGDRLQLALQAPRLEALGYGLGGRAGVEAVLGGTPAEPAGDFTFFAESLALPGGLHVGGANGQGRLDAGLEGPFRLALGLSGLGAEQGEEGEAEDWLDTARLAIEGTRAAHRIELFAAAPEDSVEATLEGGLFADDGGLAAAHWQGRLTSLHSAGRFPARLAEPVALQAGAKRVELAAARIDAGEQGRISLVRTIWTPEAVELRGSLTGLAFGVQTRRDGGPRRGPGPLVLGAEWDLRLADSAEGELRVFREAGDLQVSGEIRTRLGLEHLEAWLTARDNRLALSLDARGNEFGTLSGALTALAERGPEGGWRLAPDGELLGSARLRMPSIAWVGRLMQESVDTSGSLEAAFSFSGTPAEPLATGRIHGTDLAVALVDQGLHLSGGELLAEFDRDRLRLTRLAFVSPNRVRPRDERPPVDALTATPGTLDASGEIELDTGAGHFSFRADRLPLLQRIDRWLILSGEGQAHSTWTTLALQAAFRADAGYVELADTPAPSLSDDVVILGREPAAGGGLALSADLRVALGDQLYLSALGVDTRLTGELRLRLADGRPLAATGTIATAGGSFRGYGQNLTIERGLINFQGALDNPGLNVVALRKGLSVEAGVAIGGTVRRPQVRLVSEPSVPDPEKLSWIVLGRAPDAGSGADLGLLLPAAQALLGGPGGGMTEQLSRSLGFDEFSIGQGEVGGVSRRATSRVVGGGTVVDDGTVGGQVLTLGKRLSSDVFLSFEQSLGGAESLVKLTYQLSRRVSLVARGGTDNAVDVYYTLSFR